ncbi:hypothetical protein OBBRIDRAFT_814322 [Obba rivulosa]|uniref:Uncharacterized protein n=1 Tax=Obba rivulosa TaxID=1052685 RepID=A0A8E2AUK4_9APHY|nr:hypothetical protein OBBRIDRAFT_814322 [Obba rivulosa]
MACNDTLNNKDSWDWAILVGNLWKSHSASIATCLPHLPGSFDRPPCNSVEKINSGYKAWEFLTYLYFLGPRLFYGMLPDKYWEHFCCLQRISPEQICEAHDLLFIWADNFEDLYYNQHLKCMHFICQSVHATVHMATETMHALQFIINNLNPDNVPISTLWLDLGNVYVLKHPREEIAHMVTFTKADTLLIYLDIFDLALAPPWQYTPKVGKWGRLGLPNGQITHTMWKELAHASEDVRTSHNVRLLCNGKLEYAEVQYFFTFPFESVRCGFAMVSACRYLGDMFLHVFSTSAIQAIVAVVPYYNIGYHKLPDTVYISEKMGIYIQNLGRYMEADDIEARTVADNVIHAT